MLLSINCCCRHLCDLGSLWSSSYPVVIRAVLRIQLWIPLRNISLLDMLQPPRQPHLLDLETLSWSQGWWITQQTRDSEFWQISLFRSSGTKKTTIHGGEHFSSKSFPSFPPHYPPSSSAGSPSSPSAWRGVTSSSSRCGRRWWWRGPSSWTCPTTSSS